MATVYLTYANNPKDTQLSGLRDERNEVGRSLDSKQKDGQIILRQEDNTELNEVITGLNRHRADMVIYGFSGHAGKTLLSFTDKDANGATIAHLLRREACPHLKLVLLNGCATKGQVAALEAADVPIVIATSASVGDDAAKHFAALFFDNLSQGKTVWFAFQQARAAFSAEAGKEDRFLIRSGENRGMDFRVSKKDGPAWDFYCREERFKEWTLEMGKRDPNPPLSSISGENPPVRLLMIGKKYAKDVENRFKPEIQGGKLAIYPIDLKEVTSNKVKVTRELCCADAVIFTIDGGHFEGEWTDKDFLYAKNLIKNRVIKTVFIKEKCTDQSLEKFSADIGLPEYTFVFPSLPGFDMEALSAGGKEELMAQNLCKELKDKLIEPLKNRVLTIENRIRPEIEDFDLESQTGYLGGWQPEKKFSMVLMEGTQNCGLNLLFWKWIDQVGGDLRSQRFGLYFKSAGGVIDTESALFSKLYDHLFEETAEDVTSEIFFFNLINKLKKNPLCLIFDDPLSHETGEQLLVEFLATLLNKLTPKQESLQPLFVVVINRSLDKGALAGKLVKNFQANPILDIVNIPQVSCIEREDFDKWYGRKKARLQQDANMQALRTNIDELLHEPYLESVVSKICLGLGYKELNSKIFQPPLS